MGDLFGGGPSLSSPTKPQRDIAQLEKEEAQTKAESQSRAVRAATKQRKRGRALLLADDVSGVNVNTGKENLGG
jgi:predicted Zn-dependent peptidase